MITCAPAPLKLTVFGVEVVTSNVPAVSVSKFPTPSTAFADSCKEVPFKVVLKRLAVPLREEVPLNVAVPAVALKLPVTERLDEIEKSDADVREPATTNLLKFLLPVPEIVFDEPLIVTSAVPVSKPLTDKFPVISIGEPMLIVPVTE